MSIFNVRKVSLWLACFLALTGISYSQSKLLNESTEIEPGWYESDWLGVFYAADYPWIYSVDLEWALVQEEPDGGCWFYLMALNSWAYSSPDLYPWMYFDLSDNWGSLILGTDPLILYDMATDAVHPYGEIMPSVITVAFYLLSDDGDFVPMIDPYSHIQGMIAFDMREDPFVWNRQADADPGNEEDGHLHWNAATDMFYRDGVFSWVEYGPSHTEQGVRDMVATGEGGTRKSLTAGTDSTHFYYDHSGMYLQIYSVE